MVSFNVTWRKKNEKKNIDICILYLLKMASHSLVYSYCNRNNNILKNERSLIENEELGFCSIILFE